jgi:hypothetical protein
MTDVEKRRAVKNLNLLDSYRIGHETKQEYQDKLADYAAEGFITTEEYGVRSQWLDEAKTEADARVVFKDLPRLRVTSTELAPHIGKRTAPTRKSAAWPTFSAVMAMCFTIIAGVTGDPFFWFYLAMMLYFTVLTVYRTRTH